MLKGKEKIGRFEIERPLGRGGMGMVYLGFDPHLERYAAIKVMNLGGEVDEELRKRFIQEAKAGARLNHRNIIQIWDRGEDQKRLYIAMEYVEGEDLKTLIERKVHLPFEKKLDIIIQVCEGLQHAHRLRIIHRDIKPGNIRVTKDGEAKILDFGLARLESSEITRAGGLLGTAPYMSPEQGRGRRDLDERSDLFSVAIVLYELITYQKPFDGDNVGSIIYKVISVPHTPLTTLLPGCAQELSQIVDRALTKDKQERYSTCLELAEALRGFRAHLAEKTEELKQNVAWLQAEFDSCKAHFGQLEILDILDPALFEREEAPGSRLEETSLLNAWEGDAEGDYGSLMHRHAGLQRRLATMKQKLEEILPLISMLETARRQFEENDPDLCLGTLKEILKLHPSNARALRLQQACEGFLRRREEEEKRRQRLAEALGRAREALQRKNFVPALALVTRVLEIEPGNPEALALQQTIARGRKIEEWLGEAEKLHRNGNYEQSYEIVCRAVELAPDHQAAQQLRNQVLESIRRKRQAEDLRSRVRQLAQVHQYREALSGIDEWLSLVPHDEEARDLQRHCRQQLDRRERAETLLERVRRACESGEWTAALQFAEEALQLAPEHEGLLGLRERARNEVAKKQKSEHLFTKARTHLEAEQFHEAVEAARELLLIDADHPPGHEVLRRAVEELEREQQLQEHWQTAQKHFDRSDFEACVAACQAGLEVRPGHTGLQSLREQAHEALQRPVRVAAMLEEAGRQAAEKNYPAALETIGKIFLLEPGNQEGSRLEQSVKEASARQQKVAELAASAWRCSRAQDYESCLQRTEEAMRLDPEYPGLADLHRQAQQNMKRKQRVSELLVDAKTRLEKRMFEAALEGLNQALSLDPGNPEAMELRQRANSGLEDLLRKAMAAIERARTAEDFLQQVLRFREQGDFLSAAEVCRKWLASQPDHPRAQELLAEAQEVVAAREREVEALLVEARGYLKARNYEACCQTAARGLELQRGHTELKQIHDQAYTALEHSRKLQMLEERVEQRILGKDYDAAVDLSREMLALEPGHRRGRELLQLSEQALSRWRLLLQLQAEADDYDRAGNAEACLKVTRDALALDENNATLVALHDKSLQIVELSRRIRQLLEKANAAKSQGNFALVMSVAEEILALDAHCLEARDLRQWALRAKERQAAVQRLLSDARGFEQSGDLDACLHAASRALEMQPGDAELEELQTRVTERRNLQLRREHLWRQFQERVDEREHEAALRVLDELAEIDPAEPRILQNRASVIEARDRRRLMDTILTEARRCRDAGELEACLSAVLQGLKIAPKHEELNGLQEWAEGEIKKSRKIESLLKGIHRLWKRKDYAGVREGVQEGLRLSPQHPELQHFQQLTLEMEVRLQKVKEAFAAARGCQKAADPVGCLDAVLRGLEHDSEHRELGQLKIWAEGEVRRREEADAILRMARQQLEARQATAVLRTVEELFVLCPQHAQGLAIQEEARKLLEMQQQVNELLAEARGHEKAGDYKACIDAARRGLELDSGHSELEELRNESLRHLELEERRLTLWKILLQQQRQGEFEAALATIEVLRAEVGHDREAERVRKELVEATELRRRIHHLVEAARQNEQTGQYEAARSAARQGLDLDPEHTELKRLFDRAESALQRVRQVEGAFEAARRLWDRGDYDGCLQKAQDGLSLEPGHVGLADLQRESLRAKDRLHQVEQALASARGYLQSRDYESSWNKAQEGLKLDPTHAELKNILELARKGINQSAREKVLLEKAGQELQRKETKAVFKTVQELLAFAPGHPQALELHRQATELLARRRRIEEQLAAARGYLRAGKYEDCLQACEEGLQLEPEDSELQKLQLESEQVLEKRRKAATLLQEAGTQFQEGKYDQALERLKRLLELDPKHAEGLELQQLAKEALARQQKIEALLIQARKFQEVQQYEACQKTADEGLKLDENHAELKKLREWAHESLEKEATVRALLKKGEAQLDRREFSKVLQTVQELLSVSPDHPGGRKLQREALENLERRGKTEELLAAARGYLQSKDYETSRKIALDALKLDSGHAELRRVLESAEKGMQQQARVTALLQEARQQLEKKDPGAVFKVLDELLFLSPGNPQALELQRLASVLRDQRRKFEELLAAARGFQKGGDVEACYRACTEALTLEPDHTDLRELQQQSFRVLEEQRIQDERQARISNLLESAQNEARNHHAKGSLQHLNALLTLDPENPEALELRQEMLPAAALQRKRLFRILSFSGAGFLGVVLVLVSWNGGRGGGPSEPSQNSDPKLQVRAAEARQKYLEEKGRVDGELAQRHAADLFRQALEEGQQAEALMVPGSFPEAEKRFLTASQRLAQAIERVAEAAENERQAFGAKQRFRRALDAAEIEGVEKVLSGGLRKAKQLGTDADQKMEAHDFAGARLDFEAASTEVSRVSRAAANQRAQEDQTEAAQREDQDQQRIREVLDRYRTALRGRDLRTIKALWPKIPSGDENRIKDYFSAGMIDVSINVPPFRILDGQRANVACQLKIATDQGTYISRPTFTLEKQGADWRIVRKLDN